MSPKANTGFHLLSLPSGGRLLLSVHPGKFPGLSADQALVVYQSEGVRTLVSLLTDAELCELGLNGLPAGCQCLGIRWLHAPIADKQAPDAAFERWWLDHCHALGATLDQGHAVALHCWAGLGRTGTVAARLLMLREGLGAEAAIAAVRHIRPGSIETTKQIDYLLALRP